MLAVKAESYTPPNPPPQRRSTREMIKLEADANAAVSSTVDEDAVKAAEGQEDLLPLAPEEPVKATANPAAASLPTGGVPATPLPPLGAIPIARPIAHVQSPRPAAPIPPVVNPASQTRRGAAPAAPTGGQQASDTPLETKSRWKFIGLAIAIVVVGAAVGVVIWMQIVPAKAHGADDDFTTPAQLGPSEPATSAQPTTTSAPATRP